MTGDHGPQTAREHLPFATPTGEWVSWPADPGQDAPGTGPFRVRSVLLGEGLRAEQRRLLAPHAAEPEPRDALEDEIAALLALYRRYGRDGYPPSLPRLIGYNAEAEEPFVLYSAPEGKPVTQPAGLTMKQRRQFAQGLLAALRHLEGAGLVHRTVSPETVLWDGTQVRLAGLATAVPAGRRRTPAGTAPWASPEQLKGVGRTDPRDDVWSAAQVIYHVLAERPVNPSGPPHGLNSEAALRSQLGGAFEAAAADRPDPAAMLVRFTGRDPLRDAAPPPDPLEPGRAQFDALNARRDQPGSSQPPSRSQSRSQVQSQSQSSAVFGRLRGLRARPPAVPVPPQRPVILCPICLDELAFDERSLFSRDRTMTYQAADLSDRNALRREDDVKLLYQACTNTGGIQPHYLPVEYLLYGKPLTVAMVGRSTAGKTHLLAAMMSEIEACALEPYGIGVRPANAEWHNEFLRKCVYPLRSRKRLMATPETEFAQFEDALLLTANGVTRPVTFFDVSGENLMRTDATTRFLAGIDALIFVVDPVRAVRLPSAQAHRERTRVSGPDVTDPTFGIVLNRVRRKQGRVVPVAAMALAKSDLLRFDAPVGHWFRADPGTGRRGEEWTRESRDAFAFLAAHADRAWLRPMAECDRITAHFVSATGIGLTPGQPGGRPRRVLEPLLSVLDSSGAFGSGQFESGRFESGRFDSGRFDSGQFEGKRFGGMAIRPEGGVR